MRVIGMLSGTSYDAIEVAAGDFRLQGDDLVLTALGNLSVPHKPDIRTAIGAALPPAGTTVEAVTQLDTLLGHAFAEAAVLANEELCDGTAELIASHGQTVFHWVEQDHALGTLQLGQPAWIAERTGLPVVADLRARDVAAGGHGAPLVSLFDVLLLGTGTGTHAALNLGGIANLTIVPPDGEPFAFDVGPANALIDNAVAHFSGGTRSYDEDGRWAAAGRVNERLLGAMLDDPYYKLGAPKSTGKEYFHLPYLLKALEALPGLEPADVVATVTCLTAETVARDCVRYGVEELVIAGGGTKNPTLMGMLAEAAPGVRQILTETMGIPVTGKEAYAFGMLGFLSVHGLPGTIASCTGARRASVLGSITPGETALVLPAPISVPPRRLRFIPPAPGVGHARARS
jgi:anhydro-N-acetylmuramic acid kinase